MNIKLVFTFLTLLILNSCLDQGGVNVTQSCEEADTCKQAIFDPTTSYCVKHHLADRYDELDGSGTPGHPYVICTVAQFVDLGKRDSGWSKSFLLAQDLDLSQYYIDGGVDFQIGSCGQTTCSDFGPGHLQYSGTFDGAGFDIAGFQYTVENSEAGASMFGSISSSGVVANLNIVGAQIQGHHAMGALTGRNDGIISNVKVIDSTIDIKAPNNNSQHIGGLVGINRGVMRFVEVNKAGPTINIVGESTSNLGGVVGFNDKDAFIGDAINTSNITHDTNGIIGGIIGHNKGTLTKSKNTGDITFKTGDVGGLVGIMEHFGQVSKSYNTGNLNGGTVTNVGGLVGQITFPIYGSISASDDENRGLVINSYNTGDILVSPTGATKIGGLVGHNRGMVQASYNTGSVSGISYIGGIAGINDFTLSQNFVHDLVLNAGGGATFVGAIFGGTSAAAVTNIPTDVEKGNGIDPSPIWDGNLETFGSVTSPFNSYFNVTGSANHKDGVIQGNGVADYFDLSYELFSETYLTSCPNPLPPNTSCTPTNQNIIHWDLSSVWIRRANLVPELGF